MKPLATLPGLILEPVTRVKRRGATKVQSAAGRKRKGARVEREIAELLAELGIRALRQPLSGALSKQLGAQYAGDLRVWLFGDDAEPVVAEVKSRGGGAGFVQLERWLADYGLLVLKRNNQPPLLLLPWSTWAQLVRRGAVT
jgi:hypothetical protein